LLPPQNIEFQTDADGLVSVQNTSSNAQKRFLDVARSANALNAPSLEDETQAVSSEGSASADER
jgi:thiol:disulfide interchange protein DsbD